MDSIPCRTPTRAWRIGGEGGASEVSKGGMVMGFGPVGSLAFLLLSFRDRDRVCGVFVCGFGLIGFVSKPSCRKTSVGWGCVRDVSCSGVCGERDMFG